MTVLPPLLLRAPRLLYAAAVLFFIASLVLSYWELKVTNALMESESPMAKLSMVKAIYQAALEGLYIAIYGALTHILLAIWQDAALRRERGEEP